MNLPFAPYPDGCPEDFSRIELEQGVRGPASVTPYTNGDFGFLSLYWRTVHGPAVAARDDDGAVRAWGVRLDDGRRVHCRRSRSPGRGYGPWRRRSDDGRSWVVGNIRFEPDDVHFSDDPRYEPPEDVDSNVFQRAMAERPEFLVRLRDDSFAFTLNRILWVESLCAIDGDTRWQPSRGEAGGTIAELRRLGESYLDFKLGGPEPEPPPMPRAIVDDALAAAGWRFD